MKMDSGMLYSSNEIPPFYLHFLVPEYSLVTGLSFVKTTILIVVHLLRMILLSKLLLLFELESFCTSVPSSHNVSRMAVSLCLICIVILIIKSYGLWSPFLIFVACIIFLLSSAVAIASSVTMNVTTESVLLSCHFRLSSPLGVPQSRLNPPQLHNLPLS